MATITPSFDKVFKPESVVVVHNHVYSNKTNTIVLIHLSEHI